MICKDCDIGIHEPQTNNSCYCVVDDEEHSAREECPVEEGRRKRLLAQYGPPDEAAITWAAPDLREIAVKTLADMIALCDGEHCEKCPISVSCLPGTCAEDIAEAEIARRVQEKKAERQ